MAGKHRSRVVENASNQPNALASYTFAGSPTVGVRTFVEAYLTGELIPYMATNGIDWESGLGSFTSGSPSTMSRIEIFESSNGGAAVDFSGGGSVEVFVELTARDGDLFSDNGFVHVENSSGEQQAIPTATYTKISAALDSVVDNSRGWWDPALRRFKPSVKGLYNIGGSVSMAGISDQSFVIGALYRNGVEELVLYRVSVSAAESSTLSLFNMVPIRMDGVNDYIELFIYQNSGTDKNTESVEGRVQFRAYRLGD